MKIQLTFNYKTASLEIKITVDYQLTRHLSQGCYESILAIINAKITQYHISHLCLKHSLKFTSGFEVLVCSSLWVVRHYLVNQDIVHYGIKIVLVTQFMVFSYLACEVGFRSRLQNVLDRKRERKVRWLKTWILQINILCDRSGVTKRWVGTYFFLPTMTWIVVHEILCF